MEKQTFIQVGGSIEQAVKGEYAIDVKATLNEAWQLTQKSRISINLALLISLAFGMLVSFVFSQFMGGIEQVLAEPRSQSMLNIIVTLVISPLLAGVEMIGVYHAIGLSTKPTLVFAFLKRGSWVAVCALLTSTFVTIGLNLLYIPGLFLLVALSLCLPLVVDKKLTPLKAVIVSLQATRFQWFKMFAIYGILFGALVISILPMVALAQGDFGFIGVVMFIFAMTYLAPMYYNVKGILYREIFGMVIEGKNDDKVITDDSNFLA